MNPTEVAAFVGAFLPPVIAVLQQSRWDAAKKNMVAFLVCLLAGLLTTYATGALKVGSWSDVSWLVVDLTTVWGAALFTYHNVWQKAQITQAIEAATNLPAPRVVYLPAPLAAGAQTIDEVRAAAHLAAPGAPTGAAE